MSPSGDLVLASASEVRAWMLENAGLEFHVNPAGVDESRIKDEVKTNGGPPGDVAKSLAEAKALTVSRRRPDSWIIGADQVLVLGDEIFDKPATREEAADHLRRFRGRSHELISAVCVARDGRVDWDYLEHVTLHVREFSDRFLETYLFEAGDSVLSSVGAYRLEGLGAQLFSRIEGSYFAVLGLPLLPLLEHLRFRKVIAI